jgi:trypsin
VSGWGSQKEGGSVSRGLMYATVPTMNDDKCKEFYGKAEIFETMLCAGYSEGGIDSCQVICFLCLSVNSLYAFLTIGR